MKLIILLGCFMTSILFAETKIIFLSNVYNYDSTTNSFSSVCVDKDIVGECSKIESIDDYLKKTVCENRNFDIKGFSVQYIDRSNSYIYNRIIYNDYKNKSQFLIEIIVDCKEKIMKKNKKPKTNILQIEKNPLIIKKKQLN